MGGYANIKRYELRYSDFDFRDELKLSALLSILQESAGASADELGFGYDALKRQGFGFIVAGTYCEFHRPVGLGETLTLETWPQPPRHVIFDREYRLFDGRGENVISATSRWCLVDLANFSMLLPERLGKVHAECPYRAEKAVETPRWKLPRIANGKLSHTVTIGASFCDHYMHVNNALYADLFFDCFEMAEWTRPVKSFQICYAGQVKENDELMLFREDGEGESLLEARRGEELVTACKICF